jgi:hypothetical protein
MKTIDWLIYSERNSRFRGCGRRRQFCCWVVAIAIVFGSTQMLFAQHGRDRRGANARPEKSQGVPQSHEPVTSEEQRKHWSAAPGCFQQKSNIPDRTVSRSWTLQSPDGLYKAYAVNEATTERSDGEISGCKSTTRLFVAGPGSDEAKAALTVEPLPDASGNSIEIVDWSREGHRLVVIEGPWAWASDAAGAEARIYNADSGKLADEGLFYDAFQQLLGRKCVATFDPIGFSSDGKVVARVHPDFDYEQTLEKDSCVKKVEVWDLELATQKLRRLPDRFRVRRYGVRENQSGESSALARNVRAANTRAYQYVRTSKDWRNPFLVVRSDGVEILTGNAATKSITIPVTKVMPYLEKLPQSAWPFGLVVAVMEIGIRSVGDDVPIKRNLEQLLRLLEDAGVKVDRWPSA